MEDPDRWHGMFVQCMHALFEANGQPAPELKRNEEAADVVGFAIDGVDFGISHDTALHRDHLLLECEFGPAPQDDEWELRKLLRLNRRLQASGRGSFGWQREAAAIVFGVQLPMAQCTKAVIEGVMAGLAQQVHHWRAGRRLDADDFPALEDPEADERPQPSETDVRAQLVRVLHELCEDERVDGVEELEAPPQALALRIAVGDAEVVVVHADPGSDRLTLECEYGAAPIEDSVEALLGLLESTDAHATGGADGFGLESPADLAVYRSTCLGPDWTSRELLDEILDIARNSTEWFDTCWGSRNPSHVPTRAVNESVNVLN